MKDNHLERDVNALMTKYCGDYESLKDTGNVCQAVPVICYHSLLFCLECDSIELGPLLLDEKLNLALRLLGSNTREQTVVNLQMLKAGHYTLRIKMAMCLGFLEEFSS
ncbi:hypothetical protein Q8A67_020272 [Cirrhinus molitorella]|uniref:Uncharacterized protein n=1 Tax=Cirrhinus molitorella TaxID=172907 RepID=A0AA88PBK5_9TELE|nr:hypothetical protein Q8A67_020272 [Cirrhinus molitorella]